MEVYLRTQVEVVIRRPNSAHFRGKDLDIFVIFVSPKMTSLLWQRPRPGPFRMFSFVLCLFVLLLGLFDVAAADHHSSSLRKISSDQHKDIWRTLALEKSETPYHHLGLGLYSQNPNLDPLTLWAERLKSTAESAGTSRSKGPRRPKFHTYARVHHTGRTADLVARPTRQTLQSLADLSDEVSRLLSPEIAATSTEIAATSTMSRSAAVSAGRRDNMTDIINSVVIKGEFGAVITGRINKTTEYLFEFFYNSSQLEKKAVRVTVSSADSDYTNPLLVVVRQQRGVLSWQLPLEPPASNVILEEYRTVSRTLCPVKNYKIMLKGSLDTKQRLFIDLSTSSPQNISYSVTAVFEDHFHIELHKNQTFEITPAEPVFYQFVFTDDVEMVLVKANAEDDFCAMVAIQNITCPVFDSEENVQYGNFYQTMTYQAGITVRKSDYPNGFFIVVVMLSNDEPCSSNYQHVYRIRKKEVTLLVEEKITKVQYLSAIFAGLGFCAFFYIVTIVLGCISYIRAKRKQPRERSMLDDSIIGSPEDLASPGPSPSYAAISGRSESDAKDLPSPLPRTVSDSSLDEDDIDMLTDAESEKEIYRTKAFLYVSDLARKDMRVLTKKSELYIWGLITVGVFYAVPVMQLVITYQRVLDETGNQDLCYYNFWCAHPLGPLSDFNHVFSNISYILFGILFIGVCARRNHHHKLAVQADYKIDKYYGIPQHFGIFYAMGGSLIMEGLLSACYHICPNNSNYQFDTSFMYVISVLSMLKIYQTRHPDINASANAVYLALAFAVLLGVIGVVAGTVYFWIIFGFIHVISCLLLSGHIYYMGRWKCDLSVFRRFKSWFLSEISYPWGMLRPMYCDRIVLLLLGNAANWGLAIYGMVSTPSDFASYLLIIFLTNLLLYIAFYIIMKLRHGERLLLQSVVYLVLCLFGWGAAIFFYLHHTTTWALTPAHSRQYNQECLLLHFYDTHDVWHFLSAGAMFFGFMLLLTLDDDRALIPREKIPVF